MEWKEVKLGDVCNIITGFPFKGNKYSQTGIRVVRGDNVTLGYLRWDSDKDKRWNEPFEKKDFYSLKSGDIVIGMDGSRVGRNKATIKEHDLPLLLAQRVACIRNNENSIQEYLYYQIFSESFNKYVDSIKTGSAIPHISQKQIAEYCIPLPPLSIQRRIASILSSLDAKIENNNKINAKLEEIASNLFKNWFVDFAPFADGEFENSELGMIPKGWKVGKLGDVAEINPKLTIKKGEEATYLDMGAMPTNGSFPSEWIKRNYAGGMKFQNNDTIMARITPCLENGKVAFVNFLEDGETAFGSTEYIVMRPKNGLLPETLYCLCRYDDFVGYATKNMNGSSGRQRVSGETIGNYAIAIPPIDAVKHLAPVFKSLFEQIKINGFENKRLATLRDTLLPKLMSGEIDLDESNDIL